MPSPRIFKFAGIIPSSYLQIIELFLILSIFTAGSLSSILSASPIEKPLVDYAKFAESGDARIFEEGLPIQSLRNDSEALDMQSSSVSIANATVDFEESDSSLERNLTAETAISTEATQPSIITSSTSGTDASSFATTINSSSTVGTMLDTTNATVETTSVTTISPSTVSIVNETTKSTMTEATTATTEVTNLATMQTASSQTDLQEDTTAEPLNEDKQGMSTGIIVLVTIISFAVTGVIGYVGIVVWRRYLECRYGNRELLVNDLEFDTNDLRHFEL